MRLTRTFMVHSGGGEMTEVIRFLARGGFREPQSREAPR